jgi:putative MFS transporter
MVEFKGDLLTVYDEAPLTGRYWASYGCLVLDGMLETFDFYIVGYLIAVLAPQWHLTFGQSAVMLFGAGAGAIFGSMIIGTLADAFGRRAPVVAGTFICAASAGALSLVPDGAWWLFAMLRFGVGFGLAGALTSEISLVVELTPTRFRSYLPGLIGFFHNSGTLLASAVAAVLLTLVGWRGVAAVGIIPVFVGILIWMVVPESMRWLVTKGRIDEARASVAWLIKQPIENIPLPISLPASVRPIRLRDLYVDPRRFWMVVINWMGTSTANYGVYLWGPTIVALTLGITPKDAASYFVLVSAVGVTGRVVFSFLPAWLGRRACGQLQGFGIAVTLALAGFTYGQSYAGFPIFVGFLAAAALFFDGGFANMSPHTAESFPVRLSARGVGLGQSANGIGKVIGPACLALIAGTNNYITPQATADAVLPAFLFLAACGLAVGLSFTFFAKETLGKPLTVIESNTN